MCLCWPPLDLALNLPLPSLDIVLTLHWPWFTLSCLDLAKKIRVKKNLALKIQVKKNWSKKVVSLKHLGQEINLLQKNVWSKKYLVQKEFGQKKSWSTKSKAHKKLDPKSLVKIRLELPVVKQYPIPNYWVCSLTMLARGHCWCCLCARWAESHLNI